MEYIRIEFLVVLLLVVRVTSTDDLDKLCRLKTTIDDAVRCYDKFEAHNHGWSICEEGSSTNDCFPLHKYVEFLRKHKHAPIYDYTDIDNYYYYDHYDYEDSQSDLTNNNTLDSTEMGNATLIHRESDLNSTQSSEQTEIVLERDEECPKTPLVATAILCLLAGITIGCMLTILVLKVWKKRNRTLLCLKFGKHKEHDLENINPELDDRGQQEEPLINQYEALKPIPLGRPNDKINANRASLHHYLSINANDNDEIYENVKYAGNPVENHVESDVKNVEEYDGYKDETVKAPKASAVSFVTNDDFSGYIDCSGTALNGYVECEGGKISESESDDEQSGDIRAPIVNELKESVKRFKEPDDEDENEYVEPSKDDMYINSGEYSLTMEKDEQELYQNT